MHPYVLKLQPQKNSSSLNSGTVSSQWKHAYVSPIFKKETDAMQRV